MLLPGKVVDALHHRQSLSVHLDYRRHDCPKLCVSCISRQGVQQKKKPGQRLLSYAVAVAEGTLSTSSKFLWTMRRCLAHLFLKVPVQSCILKRLNVCDYKGGDGPDSGPC